MHGCVFVLTLCVKDQDLCAWFCLNVCIIWMTDEHYWVRHHPFPASVTLVQLQLCSSPTANDSFVFGRRRKWNQKRLLCGFDVDDNSGNGSVLPSSPLPVSLTENRWNTQVFVLFLPHSSTDDHVPVFLATPSVVVFTEYSVGHVYEVCFSDLFWTIKTRVSIRWCAVTQFFLF